MDYSDSYEPETDFDARFTRGTGRRIADWVRPGDRVLELGSATGMMTAQLVEAGAEVDAVDRSEAYLERLRARGLPGVRVHRGDFAEVDLPGPYAHVVATNLLHELEDPVAFLRTCAGRLAPAGLVHVSVPNPRSIHRLVALELGLIDSLDELSERSRRWGIRGSHSAEGIEAMAAEAGLRVVHREGVMLKPLTNAQMEQLPDAVIEGFDLVARHFPEHCGMNLLVLRGG